jgi:Uma2 family endonuclease
MTAQLPQPTILKSADIIYPDSDGQPMADNTKQFEWIVLIKKNLDLLFVSLIDVFVAGDLLWYPVKGEPKIRTAPDTMVVFGRPKGDSPEATLSERGSYQQWTEDNIPPQVVFEILSPGNRKAEMDRKLLFYERHGVEEYYIYDPDDHELTGWLRGTQGLDLIASMAGWVSPRLGIRFEMLPDILEIYRPDGKRFLSYTEIAAEANQAKQQAELAQHQVQQERQARLDAIPRLAQTGMASPQIAEILGLSIETVDSVLPPTL